MPEVSQAVQGGGATHIHAPPPPSFAPLPELGDYLELDRMLEDLAKRDLEQWMEFVRNQVLADFYFFARVVSGSGQVPAPEGSGVERAVDHPYIFQGYRIVQESPWDMIDVWPRGHWKSMTKSKDLPLWQFILHQGRICQVIVSILRELSEPHGRNLMVEMEANPLYHMLWPDYFFAKPRSMGRPWSFKEGCNQVQGTLIPRREAQFEFRGLDSLPTGGHFDRFYFDDCSDKDTAKDAEMIDKAKQAFKYWGGCENESAPGGPKRTYHGTFYAVGDLNYWIVDEGIAELRHRDCVRESDDPAFIDIGGEPIYLSEGRLRKKLLEMEENYPGQMRGDPTKGRQSKLDPGLINYYHASQRIRIAREGVLYEIIDPNGIVDDQNDECAILVVSLGRDHNFYLVDMWTGRPDPGRRVGKIIDTHIRWWKPAHVWVEEVNDESDTFWLRQEMEKRNYRFTPRSIQVPRHILGNDGVSRGLKKKTRIYNAIQPLLKEGRLWLPEDYYVRLDDGKEVNMSQKFREQVRTFPVGRSCDMLACLALLMAQGKHKKAAPELQWPEGPRYGMGFDYDTNGIPLRGGRVLPFSDRPQDWRAA